MVLTQAFKDEVYRVWGNVFLVAEAGLNETFRQPNHFSLDHDDQIDNAKRIGVIAGMTHEINPEAFFREFQNLAV